MASSKREFLDQALDAAGQWARFADPKALGVLIILGVGLNDLLKHAGSIVSSHNIEGRHCEVLVSTAVQGCAQAAAVITFAIAGLLGAATILPVSGELFPRLRLPSAS